MTFQKQTLLDSFQEIMKTKQEYADSLSPSLEKKLAAGTLSTLTAQHHTMALRNLEAAKLKLKIWDYDKALHHFSRACANLGEFIGRADRDKKST
jgi:hypothetical protein